MLPRNLGSGMGYLEKHRPRSSNRLLTIGLAVVLIFIASGCGGRRGGTIAGNPGSGGGRSATIVWLAGAFVGDASCIRIGIDTIRLVRTDGETVPMIQRQSEFDVMDLDSDRNAQVTEVMFAEEGDYSGIELQLNRDDSVIEFASTDARYIVDDPRPLRIDRHFQIQEMMDTDLLLNFELQKLVTANLSTVPTRLVTSQDAGNIVGEISPSGSLICIYDTAGAAKDAEATCSNAVSVARVGDDGSFRFSNLPAGDYVIETSASPLRVVAEVQAMKSAILSRDDSPGGVGTVPAALAQ